MLSSLLGPRIVSRTSRSSRHHNPERAWLLGRRRTTFTERNRNDADSNDSGDDDLDAEDVDDDGQEDQEEEDHSDDEEEEHDLDDDLAAPLLPLFEASHLDSLPVYALTHTIRLLVISRCETTLSWDQLRSPQVSQFLVKPIQTEINSSHFSRATLYALISNCLQFSKEITTSPANSGASRTRAMVCELLAIKLLKDYTTRELIGTKLRSRVTLGGYSPEKPLSSHPNQQFAPPRPVPRMARISTLEVAIMAQAKRFLAHPVVVQHLEAIWAGTLVFHSAADNFHRKPLKLGLDSVRSYGTTGANPPTAQSSGRFNTQKLPREPPAPVAPRRSVTLYDPGHASPFKLSRLRVPRYRQFLSTCSLAVLLCLFVAVLAKRSTNITTLEIVFWLWSAGFMLDEVVGFNEQGFGLYIMSFWNSFDVGILLILLCFYCLRIAALVTTDVDQAHLASIAYDILALNAILLFPRLFSVLDHYRYFSQLLIAFRMMVMDLMAILVLIVIACSGFFVAFTFSFGNESDDTISGGNIAYALMQMLLGFTPAAWDSWHDYNFIGRGALLVFLFISHFLIVTILITVLTNSFMEVVRNANDEHQFLFAVNTISMVKSDALFSYIAPTNVIEWILSPLRHFISFRRFVQLNRMTIKLTHFPVLFAICTYERVFLGGRAVYLTDLVDQRAGSGPQMNSLDRGITPPDNGHGATMLRRERSLATLHQDRLLEEVFRRPLPTDTHRQNVRTKHQRKTSNVVDKWMRGMGSDGQASPPDEQDANVLDRLERPQQRFGRDSSKVPGTRNFTVGTRSVASDPADLTTSMRDRSHSPHLERALSPAHLERPSGTDHDGDDEHETENWEHDSDKPNDLSYLISPSDIQASPRGLNATTPRRSTSISFDGSSLQRPSRSGHSSGYRGLVVQQRQIRPAHRRQASTNTILFRPISGANRSGENSRDGGHEENTSTSDRSGRPAVPSSPKRPGANRPDTPPTARKGQKRARQRPPPSPPPALRGMAFDLASDLGDNKAVGGGLIGALPSSFATQLDWGGRVFGNINDRIDDRRRSGEMARLGDYRSGGGRGMALVPGGVGRDGGGPPFASAVLPQQQYPRRGGYDSNEDAQRMSKLVLVRMNTLEVGFREVLQEVRDWRRDRTGESGSAPATARMEPSGMTMGYFDPQLVQRPGSGEASRTRERMSSAGDVHVSHSDAEVDKLRAEAQAPDEEEKTMADSV